MTSVKQIRDGAGLSARDIHVQNCNVDRFALCAQKSFRYPAIRANDDTALAVQDIFDFQRHEHFVFKQKHTQSDERGILHLGI